MLSHEMHLTLIANDRYTARLMDAQVYRLSQNSKRSRSIVTAISQLVVDFVAILVSVI